MHSSLTYGKYMKNICELVMHVTKKEIISIHGRHRHENLFQAPLDEAWVHVR